jgi:Cell wall-active antibiotics response 4TMS YvqF
MNRLLGAVGLLAAAGLAVPAALAFKEKSRRELAGLPAFDEDADELDIAAIFDGLEARSRATAFRGGELLVWFGGGTLDLREATLDPAGATLRVRAIFGGLEVIVPESWPVEVDANSIFGGVGDATDPESVDPTLPTLVLQILAVFGGATVQTERVSPEPILVGAFPD